MKFQLTINGVTTDLQPQFPFMGSDNIAHPANALRLWSTEALAAVGVTKHFEPGEPSS